VLNLTLAASGTVKTDAVVITGAAGVDSNTSANESGKSGITASDFETVNLSSTGVNASGTFANANDIKAGTAATGGTQNEAIVLGTNATLKITGNKHLDLTDGVGGTDVKIDASEFTGALQVLANSGANIIIGGSGNDLLDGSTGTDTFTTGAGKDTVKIDDNDAGWTTAETIKDFDIANDKLDLTGTKTAIANVITPTNAVSALTGAVAGDTLTAAVSNGVITLAGTAVSKVDTATEVKAIIELLDDDGVDAEIAVLAIATGTYVQTEKAGGDLEGDLLFLEGVSGITKVSTVSGDNTLLIA
jgi:limonene-1,2-epoxide hydrolase